MISIRSGVLILVVSILLSQSGLTINRRNSYLFGIGFSKSIFLPLFTPAVYGFVD
jgi:hypothetical protein